jgi:hypothetical protein
VNCTKRAVEDLTNWHLGLKLRGACKRKQGLAVSREESEEDLMEAGINQGKGISTNSNRQMRTKGTKMKRIRDHSLHNSSLLSEQAMMSHQSDQDGVIISPVGQVPSKEVGKQAVDATMHDQ